MHGLREALTREARAITVLRLARQAALHAHRPRSVDERAIVNAMVALAGHRRLAPTTRSTGWPWRVLPAFAHRLGPISPNSRRRCRCWRGCIPTASADVNQFHAAGGLGFVLREIAWTPGLLHGDVATVRGVPGCTRYTEAPHAATARRLALARTGRASGDEACCAALRRALLSRPAACSVLCTGNLGARGHQDLGRARRPPCDRGAGARVRHARKRCRRPSRPASSSGDVVAVVRFQGPQRQRHAGAAQARRRRWRCCRTGASAWRW
jgi:phosphogluconate dehydratase